MFQQSINLSKRQTPEEVQKLDTIGFLPFPFLHSSHRVTQFSIVRFFEDDASASSRKRWKMWGVKIQRGIRNVKREPTENSLSVSLFLVKRVDGSKPCPIEGTHERPSLPSPRIILDYQSMSLLLLLLLLVCRPFIRLVSDSPSSLFSRVHPARTE